MGLKDLAKNSPTAQRLSAVSSAGEISSLGLSFVFALLIGIGGGWWFDKRYGTAPTGVLIGLALGFAAAIRNAYVVLRKYL